jgi:murein DD-endopeptidase MepM/ murein hydrolase activator NlpD
MEMAGGRVNSVMRPSRQCTGGSPSSWNRHNPPVAYPHFRTSLAVRGRVIDARAMSWTVVLLAAAALAPVSAPAGAALPGPWDWPVRPVPMVLRGFDPPAHPWEAGHRGVDLAARPGQPVYTAGPGRVAFARDLAGRGVVTVVHGTLRTTYLPVDPTVRAGQFVAAGARIGRLEHTTGHCGPVSCLHWGLLRGTSYLDPLVLLGLGPVRLLPWWGASPARRQAERPALRPYDATGTGWPPSRQETRRQHTVWPAFQQDAGWPASHQQTSPPGWR